MPEASAHGAYHDVVAELNMQVRARPDDASLHYRLAEAHVGHDEWRACLREIEIVERLAPGAYATPSLRGRALEVAGQYAEARDALDPFLAAHPDHAEALATRGRILLHLRDPAAAAVDFHRAIQVATPREPDLFVHLATAHDRAGQPREASDAIEAGLRAIGPDPVLLNCGLGIESAAGLWDRALSRIDALQSVAPRPEPWMARRAETLAAAGRTEAARQAWLDLRTHLKGLPTLDRGSAQNRALMVQARRALGEKPSQPVYAPPAPSPR